MNTPITGFPLSLYLGARHTSEKFIQITVTRLTYGTYNVRTNQLDLNHDYTVNLDDFLKLYNPANTSLHSAIRKQAIGTPIHRSVMLSVYIIWSDNISLREKLKACLKL